VSRHNPKRTGSGAYYKKVPWHEIELAACAEDSWAGIRLHEPTLLPCAQTNRGCAKPIQAARS